MGSIPPAGSYPSIRCSKRPSPRHRWQWRKRRLEPFNAAPQHRLVAVDDRLAKLVLNLLDCLDLRGVGATEENAIGVRTVMFAR